MGATVPTPAMPDAPAYMLPGVNLFASGEYRGKPWPASDLRQIAANARRLGPAGRKFLVPPSVLGHEEDQEWLERTDLPAAGWVDPATVRVVPDPDYPGELILKGDVVNVPPEVKARLDAGEYKFGSSEIYDDFVDDFGNAHGKALRRFALLGGEVPQVKRLGSLPRAVPMRAARQFSERRGRIRERFFGGRVYAHAEASPVDRTKLIAAVQAVMPNLSAAFLESLSEDKLAELANSLPTPQPEPQMDPNMMAGGMPPMGGMPPAGGMDPALVQPGAMPPVPPSGVFADMSHEELIAALTDLGQDPATLEGMSDEELQALLDELDAEDGGEEAPADAGGPVEEMADPGAMTREELVAELTAMGQDAAALEGKSDEELQALYGELSAGSEEPAGEVEPMWDLAKHPPGGPVLKTGKLQKPRQVGTGGPAVTSGDLLRMSEQRALLRNMRNLNKLAERESRRLRRDAAAAKVRKVNAFCEQLVRDGRATPAQAQVIFKPLLLAMDDTAPVHKFSDGKVTRRLTALEVKVAEILKMPKVIHFGERFGAGGPPDNEAEVQKVREFAATLPEAAVKAGGYRDREQFVEKFSELRAKDSSLTAKKYLGI